MWIILPFPLISIVLSSATAPVRLVILSYSLADGSWAIALLFADRGQSAYEKLCSDRGFRVGRRIRHIVCKIHVQPEREAEELARETKRSIT